MAAISFPWLDQKEYPFRAHYFEAQGQKMHYIDEGQGETLLFVHGTPSWSFDFRYQIEALSSRYRCVAVDHIGFGLSDKPAHFDYSVQNHARILEAFIGHLGLKDITLVVHDFGGPIGFDYALKHPANIKRLIVLNSWLWSAEGEPEFRKMKPILKSPLLPFLYRRLNFSPRYLLPQSFFDKSLLSKNTRRQYTGPFPGRSERSGPLAFAKSLLMDQDWFESLWKQIHLLADKPILFIWGMNDTFVSPKYLEKFAIPFSRKTLARLEECGHFPQEEKKEEVLEQMRRFLSQ
ncbi:MAG: alpha/beta fold hydrolase [Saprospirales bacterium]|nr:alpha/beta fold hydrolase [Saprospirales bacterium]